MESIKQTLEVNNKSPEAPKEMGFQSYELLAGDTAERKLQQEAFLSDNVRNPDLDYPHLDENDLDQGIRNLEAYLEQALQHEDPLAADALYDSASYRLAEIYWLKEAARLNRLAQTAPDSDEFKLSAKRYQEANEQLYGTPEKETIEKVYGEVIAQAQSKNLHPSAQKIYDELVNGTTVTIADEEIEVPGIGEDHPDRLPGNLSERLASLREFLKEEFKDVFEIVDQYWDEEASLDEDGNKQFTVDDMKALFERVHTLRDPNNDSGISVVIHPGSSQLAWDTPSTSIRIGESRAPITSKTDMVAKIIHEYGVHGLRAVNGQKSDLDVMKSGMYSDADEGERSDYLTFEEGFASLAEMAIDDSFSQWKPLHVSRYLVAASKYQGADFRQAFEQNWRARLLMSIGDGKEVTEALVNKERKQAHLSTVRLLRGTPTNLTDGPTLTFNKDLAYLSGKLDGLKYIDQAGDDAEAYAWLLKGKFDPNNQRQAELAQRYAA